MKAIVAALTAIVVTASAAAEDALVEGGRSPDGRYEVRLVRTPNYNPNNDGSEYLFHIRAGDKPLVTVPGSGFRGYPIAKEYCKALWDRSSRFVAITDRETRHTTALHIVSVLPDGTRQFEIPDFVQNALGRVNATEVDFACTTTPKRWDGDDLIVQLYFTANGRHTYTCDVTLHVHHEERSMPSLGLKAVSKPKEDER
jgi:hypothetical protein